MIYSQYSFQNVFQYENDDIYWCTADIGWITGHSYIIYGPTFDGATTLMFEGVPTYPNPGRFWDIVDKYKGINFILHQLLFVLYKHTELSIFNHIN